MNFTKTRTDEEVKENPQLWQSKIKGTRQKTQYLVPGTSYQVPSSLCNINRGFCCT